MKQAAKQSIYNIIYGILGQILILSLGIIIPRLFIVNLGSAANGLLCSIGQIIAYLVLLEAGLGTASIQALYEPIAAGNINKINLILSTTAKYYKKTSLIYACSIFLLAVTYPLSIKEFSYIEVFFVVLLSGFPGVINYYFNGKLRVLIQAEGKSYIINNINTSVYILSSVVKIALINFNFGLLALQISFCVVSIIQLYIYHVIFKRYYSWVSFNGRCDSNLLSKKTSALIHQISSLVLTNSPIIVLTFFAGLKEVSVFVIYSMIFDIATSVMYTVSSSINHILATYHNKNHNLFLLTYDVYEGIYITISGALLTIVYLYTPPFIHLYTNDVTDINYDVPYLAFLFTLFKLLASFRTPSLNLITIVGKFKETQNAAVLEAIISFILSTILVLFYGIIGVILGNIIALIFRAILLIHYSNTKIINRSNFHSITYAFFITAFFLITTSSFHNFIAVSYSSYYLLIKSAVTYSPLILIFALLLYFSVNFITSKSFILLIKSKSKT